MNWEFIEKYLPMYEKAALLTVKIGIVGILFAILVGLICAAVQYYKVPVLRWIVTVYVELSRNTPLLVQLFFIYYGFPKIGIRMSAELCGVVGLAFLGGSYMAESFRSGLESVEPIQSESAISLGMNSRQVLGYVILPPGNVHQYSCICGKYHFPVKRDQCVQRHQSDGPDVHRQRPDRSLL